MKAKQRSSKHFMTRYFEYRNGWVLEIVGELGLALEENERVRIRILDSKGRSMRPGKKGESQNWLIHALMYDFQWLQSSIWVEPSEALWLHGEIRSYANQGWVDRMAEKVYDTVLKFRRRCA